MSAFLVKWLSLSTGDKAINLCLVLAALFLVGLFIVRFFKALKIQTMAVSKDGLSISKDKEETKTENKVAPVLTSLLEIKEKDIKKIEAERDSLRKDVQNLQSCLDKIEYEENIRNEETISLHQHVFFFRLKQFMERGIDISFIPHKPWSGEKKAVNETFLVECKIKVFYEGIKEWVEEIEKIRSDSSKAMNKVYEIVDLIYKLIDDYNKEALSIKILLPSGYIIIGVPSAYTKKFDEWHTPHIQAMLMKIQGILYSEFYKSWRLKLTLILEQLDTSFLQTIMDAERTLNELNGELDKEIEEKVKLIK